jgi:hypothetical protein
MLPTTNIQSIVGATLFGPGEAKIGRIAQVFVDPTDGHPTWVEVHVGALARHSTLVPLHEATWEHDDVYVPYGKDRVKAAPRLEGDGGLDPAYEHELIRHYADPGPGTDVTDTDATDTPGADTPTTETPTLHHHDKEH